jgi:phasin family protein
MKLHAAHQRAAVNFSPQEDLMFATSEQLSAATKAVFDAHLASATALSQALFDSSKTLLELNVSTAKESLTAAAETGTRLLAAKDPQEWLTLSTNHTQQAMERARAYSRDAKELGEGARSKFSSVAENELATSKQKVGELVEAVKQAPTAATVPVTEFFKNAYEKTQSNIDQFAKAGQKAASDAGDAFKAQADKLATA